MFNCEVQSLKISLTTDSSSSIMELPFSLDEVHSVRVTGRSEKHVECRQPNWLTKRRLEMIDKML